MSQDCFDHLTPILSYCYGKPEKILTLASGLHYPIATKQDWLPGVAGTQPRLGFRFWGVSSEEGGLHQPPFSVSAAYFVFLGG
jgi:hypothetical protein